MRLCGAFERGAVVRDGLEKTWKMASTRSAKEANAAMRAVQVLNSIEISPLKPQQLAVLVSGSLLACSWRYLSQRVYEYDQKGLQSLIEVWVILAAALGLGQLAQLLVRRHLVQPSPVVPSTPTEVAVASSGSSSSSSRVQNVRHKEGLQVAKAVEPFPDDLDDVAVQKRKAQAEAAAKLVQCQQGLQQLLTSICKTDTVADDIQLLHKLADQLFSSPLNLCEFVSQGGVRVVMSASRSALKDLTGTTPSMDVLPALMQASWVLLQVAHGPPACWAALADDDSTAQSLLDMAQAVMAVPARVEAKESILRNLMWILLILCDGGARSKHSRGLLHVSTASSSSTSSSSLGFTCAAKLVADSSFAKVLEQLVSLQFGLSPGWVAAAMLGLLIQLGQQQQQQQQHHQQQLPSLPQVDQQLQESHQQQDPAQLMVQAAVQAALQPDSLHGLGHLLHHQPQLSDRLCGLVHGQLHFLISFYTTDLLQLLIEERLVGTFAAGAPRRLGRLLVCQLLSGKGQEVMSRIEEAYELDVPVALAQVIPIPVHLKLPPAPGQQQHEQQQQRHSGDEIEPAVELQQQQQQGLLDDVYTDILACRLLLQHSRLDELLTAFADELLVADEQHTADRDDGDDAAAAQIEGPQAAQPAAAEHGAAAASMSPVGDAVLVLIKHLMSRDLQLQAVQHMRGDSVDDSLSSLSSSSGNSVIDVALSLPDETGTFSQIMQGLVPDEQLPAAAAAGPAKAVVGSSGTRDSLLTLPLLAGCMAEACNCVTAGGSSSNKKCNKVVFSFGDLRHAVDRAVYKQIRHSSKLVASILGRQVTATGQPVTVLTTPHFTPEANLWVLQCLERWLTTNALVGFSALQAAKLWVAADFLQIDGLQVACEDVIIAATEQDAHQLDVALELCSRHRSSSTRLQRLAVQGLLKRLSDNAPDGVHRLRMLLQQHQAVLVPSIYAEVRDRLVTLCMLNAGLVDDAPGELVE